MPHASESAALDPAIAPGHHAAHDHHAAPDQAASNPVADDLPICGPLEQAMVALWHQLDHFAEHYLKQYKRQPFDLGSHIEPIQKTIDACKTVLKRLEAQMEDGQAVMNPYHEHFLRAVSRWNSLFYTVKYVPENLSEEALPAVENPAPKPNDNDWKTKFADLNLTGFESPLLERPANLTFSVKHTRFAAHEKFTEPHRLEISGRQRWFYPPEKDASPFTPEECEASMADYAKKNQQIGLATQRDRLEEGAKCSVRFFSNALGYKGSAKQSFYPPVHEARAANDRALFREAEQAIAEGRPLTLEQWRAYSDGYLHKADRPVRLSKRSFVKKINEPEKIMLIAHAGIVSDKAGFTVVCDPVHGRLAKGAGLAEVGGRVGYPNQLEAAFKAHSGPGPVVIWISHNHMDHMDLVDLAAWAAGKEVIVLLPKSAGSRDKNLLLGHHLRHVIEVDWNDRVQIEMRDSHNKPLSLLTLNILPAKHASNRELTADLFAASYTSLLLQAEPILPETAASASAVVVSPKPATFFSGDTAVWGQQHLDQLKSFLKHNQLTITSACLAFGPDRPRDCLACTHQSSADALAFLDYLQHINPSGQNCDVIPYHHSCFKLGRLSYSDVETTIMRMLLTLICFGDTRVRELSDEQLQHNYYYQSMDGFERVGLLKIIAQHQAFHTEISAKNLADNLAQRVHVLVPGQGIDVIQQNPFMHGFKIDGERLIVNQDPVQHCPDQLYEYFALEIDPDFYRETIKIEPLIKAVLDAVAKRSHFSADRIQQYLRQLPGKLQSLELKDEFDFSSAQRGEQLCRIQKLLAEIYIHLLGPTDYSNSIRVEGVRATAMVVLANLFSDPTFKTKLFKKREQVLEVLEEQKRRALPDCRPRF